MSTSISRPSRSGIVYPDSDGEPMAENTLQFTWIVTIKENLEIVFLDRPDVFVAGDLLWYPVEGDPKTRMAPDAMVAIGRPKGYRGSYMQWEEAGIAPQVVFEVLSPGNRAGEMERKRLFYERFGVEEYYLYDPDTDVLTGYQRLGKGFVDIPEMNGWGSPRLGIRFNTSSHPLVIQGPDGHTFRSFSDLEHDRREVARERDILAYERDAVIHERDAVIHERDALARQAEEQAEKARRLEAKLRELGIEP